MKRILLSLVICLSMLQGGSALSDGIGDVADNGCVCHGGQDDSVTVELAGLPDQFIPGETYNITISIDSNLQSEGAEGGFRVIPSHGSFNGTDWRSADDGWSHKQEINDRRSWSGTWTAPNESDVLATFILHGNAVNGDYKADDDDDWNSASYAVPGPDYTGEVTAPDVGGELGTAELLVGGIALLLLGWLTWAAMKE